MLLAKNKCEGGFSLVEVIVAMGLSLIVFYFVLKFISFNTKYIGKWLEKRDLEEKVAFIYSLVWSDLQTRGVEFIIDSLAVRIGGVDKVSTYFVEDGGLIRNNYVINKGLKVESFFIVSTFKDLLRDSLFSFVLAKSNIDSVYKKMNNYLGLMSVRLVLVLSGVDSSDTLVISKDFSHNLLNHLHKEFRVFKLRDKVMGN